MSDCCALWRGLQKRPSPDNNGASASMQRPLLAGLGPSPAAASLPEVQSDKRLKLKTQHADCSSRQSPASSAQRAQRPPPQPPDPSLGGVSIQRCGQLRYHKASTSSASGQHSSPQSSNQPTEAATRPEAVHGSVNIEQQHCQHAGEPSQGITSASSHVGVESQKTLKLQWRVKMKECVDASPLILMQRHVVDGQLTTR